MKKRMLVIAFAFAVSLGTVRAESFPVQASEMTDNKKADGAVTRSLDEETFSKLVDFVQEKWDSGELENADDIREAIAEGEKEFGFNLSEETENTIVKIGDKVKDFDIDSDLIADKAEELYETYGDGIVNNIEKIIAEEMKKMGSAAGEKINEQLVKPVKEAVAETAKSAAKNFFSDLKNSVADFVKNIFRM